MHMTKYTFIRPLSHSEVVALATRHWPMPCAIEIRHPIVYGKDWSYMNSKQSGRKYTKPFKWFKFNRARKATAK